MPPKPPFARWWRVEWLAALRSLLHCRSLPALRQSLRYLLCPIDLWRYYEVAPVIEILQRPGHALDIGSPKVLASLVRRGCPAPVICSDIAWDALQLPGFDPPRLQCDGLHLPFADQSLPFAYSVSAIEHIADHGDSAAMREIARVLETGGVAVITVPLVPAYTERWVASDPYGKQARDAEGRVFFSRYYDWAALQTRVINTPGLRVVQAFAWQEKRDGWYANYCENTARPASLRAIAIKLFDPIWAAHRIEPVPGGPQNATRHGIAAIVLEKLDDASSKHS